MDGNHHTQATLPISRRNAVHWPIQGFANRARNLRLLHSLIREREKRNGSEGVSALFVGALEGEIDQRADWRDDPFTLHSRRCTFDLIDWLAGGRNESSSR